jgi:hypothetical protein
MLAALPMLKPGASGGFDMRLMIAILVAILAAIHPAASAQGVRPNSANVDAAIDRGLDFLVKDAHAWKNEHKCVSCHHASLVVWAMREARQFGHAVNEPVLTELTN